MILAIDTSGSRCGVGLWADGPIGYLQSEASLRHNEILLGQIQALLRAHDISLNQLSAVAVSSGPGSFTGLRVGMATAKGLCWSHHLNLICVPTLDALAATAPARLQRVLPLMPARAREVYYRLYEHVGDNWQPQEACAVSEVNHLAPKISANVFLCGEGYERHRDALDGLFADRRLSLLPSESLEPEIWGVARIAQRRLKEQDFDDSMMAEPKYHYSFPAQPAK